MSKSESPSVSPSASPSLATGAQGQINFECTIDGTNWYQLPCTPIDGSTAVVNAALDGLWRADVSGLSLVRCSLIGNPLVLGAWTVYGLGNSVSGA